MGWRRRHASTPMRAEPAPPLSFAAWLRRDAIDRFLAEANPASVIEVGCGQGALGYRLAQCFDYRGYEPDARSASVAGERLSRIGRGEVVNGYLPDTPDRLFDLLIACEVLEHIEDDAGALSVWQRWVRPGGHLLLSVPAHPSRFGPADRHVGHVRRYTRDGLAGRMTGAGLEVRHLRSYGFPLAYALEFVRNRAASRSDRPGVSAHEDSSGRWLQPGSRLRLVPPLVTFPFRFLQRPFGDTNLGTGFVSLARKS